MVDREGKLSKTQDGKKDSRPLRIKQKRKLTKLVDLLSMQVQEDLSDVWELSESYRARLKKRNHTDQLKCADVAENPRLEI